MILAACEQEIVGFQVHDKVQNTVDVVDVAVLLAACEPEIVQIYSDYLLAVAAVAVVVPTACEFEIVYQIQVVDSLVVDLPVVVDELVIPVQPVHDDTTAVAVVVNDFAFHLDR